MSDLQAIADRVQIEALRGEFADAVMMNDHDRLASLFTRDGVVRIHSPHSHRRLGQNQLTVGVVEKPIGYEHARRHLLHHRRASVERIVGLQSIHQMWRTIVGVCSLLVQPVAKTWCQNSAIFSSSGRFVLTIRQIQRPFQDWTLSMLAPRCG